MAAGASAAGCCFGSVRQTWPASTAGKEVESAHFAGANRRGEIRDDETRIGFQPKGRSSFSFFVFEDERYLDGVRCTLQLPWVNRLEKEECPAPAVRRPLTTEGTDAFEQRFTRCAGLASTSR